jgi:hypothetical protein
LLLSDTWLGTSCSARRPSKKSYDYFKESTEPRTDVLTKRSTHPARSEPVMVINEKAAHPLKLHCPLQCGGYIENEILMYLLEGDELYVYGKCGECGQGGNLQVSLIELISKCPTLAIQ